LKATGLKHTLTKLMLKKSYEVLFKKKKNKTHTKNLQKHLFSSYGHNIATSGQHEALDLTFCS